MLAESPNTSRITTSIHTKGSVWRGLTGWPGSPKRQTRSLLLSAVAERLTMLLPPGDTLARLSGDEFVILCEDLGDEPSQMLRPAPVLADASAPQENHATQADLNRQPHCAPEDRSILAIRGRGGAFISRSMPCPASWQGRSISS